MEIFTLGQRIKLNKSPESALNIYKNFLLSLSIFFVFVLDHLNNSKVFSNQKFYHSLLLMFL